MKRTITRRRRNFHIRLTPSLLLIFFSLHCQSPKSQIALKSDAFRNAEQTALERGRQIYFDSTLGTNGFSCNSCHPDGMETRAEAYPRYKHVLGTMATLSMTHNFAVVNENRGKKWELGSEDANALALYVTFLANGKKMYLSEPRTFQNAWIEKGKTAFTNLSLGTNGKSCASCHVKKNAHPNETFSNLKGIAAKYPRFRARENRVLTLEQQINLCLDHQMDAEPLPLDHEILVGLVCYLASQSQGVTVSVAQ